MRILRHGEPVPDAPGSEPAGGASLPPGFLLAHARRLLSAAEGGEVPPEHRRLVGVWLAAHPRPSRDALTEVGVAEHRRAEDAPLIVALAELSLAIETYAAFTAAHGAHDVDAGNLLRAQAPPRGEALLLAAEVEKAWLAARRRLPFGQLQRSTPPGWAVYFGASEPADDVPAVAQVLAGRARPASRAEYLLFLDTHIARGAALAEPAGAFPAPGTATGVWLACADLSLPPEASSSLTLLVPSSVRVTGSTGDARILDMQPGSYAGEALAAYNDLGAWHLGRLRESPPSYDRACSIVGEGDARAGHPSQRAQNARRQLEAGAVTAAQKAAARWGV